MNMSKPFPQFYDFLPRNMMEFITMRYCFSGEDISKIEYVLLHIEMLVHDCLIINIVFNGNKIQLRISP